METVQKFKTMSLMSDICTVLDQIRWEELKVSELKPTFYSEFISSNHTLSNHMGISQQLRGFVSQSTNASCIKRVKMGSFPY